MLSDADYMLYVVNDAWEELENSDEWKAYEAAKAYPYDATKDKLLLEEARNKADAARELLQATPQWIPYQEAYEACDWINQDELDKVEKLINHLPEHKTFHVLREEMMKIKDTIYSKTYKSDRKKRETEEALLESKVWKRWVEIKRALLAANPAKDMGPDYDKSSAVYKDVWQNTRGDHDKAIKAYNAVLDEKKMVFHMSGAPFNSYGRSAMTIEELMGEDNYKKFLCAKEEADKTWGTLNKSVGYNNYRDIMDTELSEAIKTKARESYEESSEYKAMITAAKVLDEITKPYRHLL